MSRNKTFKGLAFGAGLALVASGLAGVPAQAAGLTGFVELVPNTGPAFAKAVVAQDGATFSLKASPASTVMSGGEVKFLVTDPSAKFLPGAASTGGDTAAIAAGATDFETVDAALDLLVLDVSADGVADGVYFVYPSADLIIEDNGNTDALAVDVVVLAKNEMATAVVAGGNLLITSANDVGTAGSADYDRVLGAVSLTLVKGGADGVTSKKVTYAEDTTDITTTGGNATIPATAVGDGSYILFSAANLIVSDNDANSAPVVIVTGDTPLSAIQVSSNVATIPAGKSPGTVTNSETHLASVAAQDVYFISSLPNTSARASDNSFVVGTDLTTAGQTALLELVGTDTTTRTVDVTAFVDAFADGEVGSTEYVSATETITFVKSTDIAATTTLTAPNVGDETLKATTTTVPVLNEEQMPANMDIRALFTRAGSSTPLFDDANATQADLTGIWTSEIDLELDGNAGYALESDGTLAALSVWTDLVIPEETVNGATDGTVDIASISVSADKVATITTDIAHGLESGDKVTVVVAEASAKDPTVEVAEETAAVVTVTGSTTFTYAMTETADVTAATDSTIDDATEYTVVTYADIGQEFHLSSRVFVGDYSARSYFTIDGGDNALTVDTWAAIGTSSAAGTLSTVANDITFTTTGTSNVQAISDSDAASDSAVDLLLKTGTTSATVVATVVDEDGDAIGSGRTVEVTHNSSTSGAGVKVSGEIAAGVATLTTDANGQVEIVVTSTNAANNDSVIFTAEAEGVDSSITELEINWKDATWVLADLNVTDSEINLNQDTAGKEERYVAAGSSYDMRVLVADQWGTVGDSADYRLKVSGSGVNAGFYSLTSGIASITINDSQVSTDFDTAIELQKKGTTGVFADLATAVSVTVNTKTDDNPGILLGADGSSLYGFDGSETADLSDAVALKAIVERDTRTSFVVQPVYTNSVVVTGKIVDDASKTALGGAVVTVSGPSNILFSAGSVESRGSITFLADEGLGEWDVTLRSTTAQTDTVITVTSMGVSSTTKVSFVGAGIGEGTSLVVTMPAAVKPASTFQVKALLTDAYGNGVNTGDVMKVTYSGPGIVYGTLPTETDANGAFQFSVLLGSNDTGTVSVTVSYDQNADGDYLDTKDLTTVGTTAITATGVAASETKVNVGSFKGYVALYAKGYAGQKMSAIVAGKWIVVESLASDFERVVRFTGAGYSITTKIYIDGVQIGDAFTTMTK
jgi:hypothetical protein